MAIEVIVEPRDAIGDLLLVGDTWDDSRLTLRWDEVPALIEDLQRYLAAMRGELKGRRDSPTATPLTPHSASPVTGPEPTQDSDEGKGTE